MASTDKRHPTLRLRQPSTSSSPQSVFSACPSVAQESSIPAIPPSTTHDIVPNGGHAQPIASYGTYHEWSIHPTPSPSTTGKRHSRTVRANHTFRGPFDYRPPFSASPPKQHVVLGHYVDDPVELRYPYTTAPTEGLMEPQSPSVAGDVDASASHSPPTTPYLDTDCGSFSAYSSSPPSPVTAGAPKFNAAQEGEENEDLFNAVYQESFVRRSSYDFLSSPQPPAPVLSTYYAHTSRSGDDEPQHYAYSAESAPVDNAHVAPGGTDSTVSVEKDCRDMHGWSYAAQTAYSHSGDDEPQFHAYSAESTPIESDNGLGATGTIYSTTSVEQDCRDIHGWSYAAHTAYSGGGEPVAWSAPYFYAAYADGERSGHTTNDAYAHHSGIETQPPAAAQRTTYAIAPSPPSPQSSYLEVEQALHFSPHSFTEDSDGALSTTGSASLYPLYSGVDTPSRFYCAPSYPQDASISEDEYSPLIQECIDANERLQSEVSRLDDVVLGVGLHYDTY